MKTGLVLLALLCAARAPATEYEELEAAYREASQKWMGQLRAASQPAEAPRHPAIEFMPKFRALAERHAGRPEALPALGRIAGAARFLDAPPGGPPPADVRWAFQRLREDHAADPGLKDVLPRLRYSASAVGDKPLEELYEAVIRQSKDPESQAIATFQLACLYYEDESPDRAAARRQRAEALFRKAAADYPGTKAAKSAEGYIYEIEHLQIGMVAPEIVGTDASGKEIRLSQFRGQVVVLNFFGFW